jgi:hypothetical protein
MTTFFAVRLGQAGRLQAAEVAGDQFANRADLEGDFLVTGGESELDPKRPPEVSPTSDRRFKQGLSLSCGDFTPTYGGLWLAEGSCASQLSHSER